VFSIGGPVVLSDMSGQKKKARRVSAPSFKLYFKNSKLEGVIVP
jgi:hypothetical protein